MNSIVKAQLWDAETPEFQCVASLKMAAHVWANDSQVPHSMSWCEDIVRSVRGDCDVHYPFYDRWRAAP